MPTIPPPPPGFEYDAPPATAASPSAGIPPPPPGFEFDAPPGSKSPAAAPAQGFFARLSRQQMEEQAPGVPAPPLPHALQSDQEQQAEAPTFQNPKTGRIYHYAEPGKGNVFENILDTPITGAQEVAAGVEEAAEPGLRPKAGGAAKIIGGVMQAASPLAVATGAVAPVQTLGALAAGYFAQKGTQAALNKLGVAPEYSDLAGTVAALFAGYGAGKIRYGKNEQNLVELLRGQEPHGSDNSKIAGLKAHVDSEAGDINERRAAQSVLKNRFGIDYGPDLSAEPEEAEQSPTPAQTTATGSAPTTSATPPETLPADFFEKQGATPQDLKPGAKLETSNGPVTIVRARGNLVRYTDSAGKTTTDDLDTFLGTVLPPAQPPQTQQPAAQPPEQAISASVQPQQPENQPSGTSDITNQLPAGVATTGQAGAGAEPNVPEGNGPELVGGLPGPGVGESGNGEPEPTAGSEGQGVRRVTGSADVPLTDEGERQAEEDLAPKAVVPFDKIVAAPNTRSRETAEKFGSYDELPSLNGWARGQYEGQPADSVQSEMSQLILNPDEVPPGRSPLSGEPGQSWNQMAKPMFRDVQELEHSLGPDQRALMVTSGGNMQAIDAWGKAGFPADYEFDHSELAANPYWSVTGKLFRLTPKGLQEVPNNAEPGLYLSEHGETAFNQKPTQSSEGVIQPEAEQQAQPAAEETAPVPQFDRQGNGRLLAGAWWRSEIARRTGAGVAGRRHGGIPQQRGPRRILTIN